jgi:hypothetical protein
VTPPQAVFLASTGISARLASIAPKGRLAKANFFARRASSTMKRGKIPPLRVSRVIPVFTAVCRGLPHQLASVLLDTFALVARPLLLRLTAWWVTFAPLTRTAPKEALL